MPNYANALVYKINQAIREKDIVTVANLLSQLDDENINDYDLKDLVTKKRMIDCAVEQGTPEILELVCKRNPKLDEYCESTGRYPIHAAMMRDVDEHFEKMFEILYSANANFRLKERITENSLVHMAIKEKDKTAFIPALVKLCRCDVNAIDSDQHTPLWCAIDKFGQDAKIVHTLKELGATMVSNATMELHNQINRQYELYLKYAKRYPVKFRAEAEDAPQETDEEFAKLGSTPLLANSIMSKPADQSIIDSHVLAISKNIPDKIYQQFLNKLTKRTDKDEIIEGILKKIDRLPSNPTILARIALLKSMQTERKNHLFTP